MTERFTLPRLRYNSAKVPYISLCGAKLAPGSLVDVQLPDDTVVRHLTTQQSMTGQYVVVGMHGIPIKLHLLENELRVRRVRLRKRKKPK